MAKKQELSFEDYSALIDQGLTDDDILKFSSGKIEEQVAVSKERKSLPFMDVGTKAVINELLSESKKPNPINITKGIAGRMGGNVLAALQREEAVATEILRFLASSGKDKNPDRIAKALSGEISPEMGDLARELDVPEPIAASLGLVGASMLPSSLLGGKLFQKAVSKNVGRASKVGASLTGVKQEILQEVKDRGFRNVLNKKYYSKDIPSEIQDVIIKNADDYRELAQSKFDAVAEPLRNTPVPDNYKEVLTKDIIGKTRIFDTKSKEIRLAKKWVDIIENAKIDHFGDLLDLRRNLDEVIFNERGRLVGTERLSKIRKNINSILHKDSALKEADSIWTTFQSDLADVVDDISNVKTGENILKRFGSLTKKHKNVIIDMENTIKKLNPNAKPFIDDLTNYSLAQEFLPTQGRTSVSRSQIIERALLPAYRGALRTGELLSPTTRLISNALKRIAIPTSRVLLEDSTRKPNQK